MFVAGLYQQVRKTPAFMSANFNLVIAYAKGEISQGSHPASPSYSSTAATLDIQQG